MEELPLLFQQNPTLQQINLEFSELESLDPILPILSKFSMLKELLLFGNRLETLPKDLSCLQYLEKLDISNNLIENLETIIQGLSSLPSLVELHVTLQTENDEELLIKSLPKLANLNGSAIERPHIDQSISESSSIFNKDLEDSPLSEKNAEIKVQEKNPVKEEKYEDKEGLSQAFITKMGQIVDKIKTLDKNKEKVFSKNYEEVMKSISTNLAEKSADKSLVKSRSKYELAIVCQSHLVPIIVSKLPEYKVLEDVLLVSTKAVSKLLTFSTKAPAKVAKLDLSELNNPKPFNKSEKESLLKQFQEERKELQEEIESLREENKKYLETIVRHSKSYAESSEALKKSIYLNKSIEEELSYSSSPVLNKPVAGKLLSLRQLKEVIEEIYVSKAKYDERCLNSKMPRETMEQHMYNYLNTKYGLKSLILEWAASIITSVKKHSSIDNDVAVFGKILRNECDEEFRFVQVQVKETVAELLKLQMKNKFPLKNNNDIVEMTNQKINGYLFEDEWNEIVKYMYNEDDSSMIINDLWMIINKKNNKASDKKIKVSREEAVHMKEKEKIMRSRVLFADFLKVLLDFQLEGHEKFLEKFLKLFRSVDVDADGIINEFEFQNLVVDMEIGFDEEDISRLLQIIDPFDHQQITFSECVGLFSTEIVPEEGIPVMKKLSLAE